MYSSMTLLILLLLVFLILSLLSLSGWSYFDKTKKQQSFYDCTILLARRKSFAVMSYFVAHRARHQVYVLWLHSDCYY